MEEKYRVFCDAVLAACPRATREEREEIRRELLDHLEDKATDLMRIFPGLTREEAEQRALEEMGAAEELGEELARVHSPLVGELWQLTRFLIRAVLVVLAVECLWLLWKFA